MISVSVSLSHCLRTNNPAPSVPKFSSLCNKVQSVSQPHVGLYVSVCLCVHPFPMSPVCLCVHPFLMSPGMHEKYFKSLSVLILSKCVLPGKSDVKKLGGGGVHLFPMSSGMYEQNEENKNPCL